MKLDTHSLITSAVQKFQSGRLIEAESDLNLVLKAAPDNFDALNILGILKISQNKYFDAKSILKRAYIVKASDHALSVNLGLALINLGAFDEAIAVYEAALQHHPNDPHFLFGLAYSFYKADRKQDAIKVYGDLLKAAPSYLNARINLAAIFSEYGDFLRAKSLLEEVLDPDISVEQYWLNLAATYVSLKMWTLAKDGIEKALQINSSDPYTFIRHGEILLALGEAEEALKSFQNALDLRPNTREALVGLANSYVDLGFDEHALSILDKVLFFEANNAAAWSTKGMLLKNMGAGDRALDCFSRAIQIDASIPESKYNSSHIQLEAFNFIEGWENYEHRWSVKAFNSQWINIDKPLWNGEPLRRALLIWAEQGVGDQILYASILSLAIKKTSKISVLVDDRLVPIFKRSFPNISFVSSMGDINLDEIEAHLPIGSLGKYFLRSVEDFTLRKAPYLVADKDRSVALKKQMKVSNGLICGLAWSSRSMKHSADKSFEINELRPILNSEKMTYVDIGYLDSESERVNLLQNFSIKLHKFQEVDSFKDIDGLASIIDLCDLVITCSNTCAHLAGALGKKVYLMVPLFKGRFWYWQDIEGTSLWYPSVKIIARGANEDWDTPVNKLKQMLGV